MSRTKRKHPGPDSIYYFGLSDEDLGRDRKPGSKPPSWWKRLRKRIRRHKNKQLVCEGKEISKEKKTDIWDWN